MPQEIVENYELVRRKDPSRPVLLNLGQGVAWDDCIGRGVRRNHPEDYPQYIHLLATVINSHAFDGGVTAAADPGDVEADDAPTEATCLMKKPKLPRVSRSRPMARSKP